MFNTLFAIGWKDALVRFASRSELLFFLILPLVFTTLMSGSLFAQPDEDADNRIPLLVVDADGSDLAQALVTALGGSGSVRPVVDERAAAEAAFADEEAPGLLIIPAGFAEAVRAGTTAELTLDVLPNNNNGLAVQQAVTTAVAEVSQPLAVAQASLREAEGHGLVEGEAAEQAYFEEAAVLARATLDDAPQRIRVTQPETARRPGEFVYDQAAHTAAGQLVTWVFIPLLGISGLFAFERTHGTLRRLLTTPTKRGTYVLGTIGGQYVTALVQMALLVGFGLLVLRVDWGDSPAGLVLILATFGLAGVSMGTMLATFVKTAGQASGISIMLGMAMALLGGAWWPYELFPPALQQVVQVLPTTWAMRGLTDLTMRGLGFADVLPEAAVLVGFAVVFFVVGVWRFRYESSI